MIAMTTGAKSGEKPLCTLPMGCCDSLQARSCTKSPSPQDILLPCVQQAAISMPFIMSPLY